MTGVASRLFLPIWIFPRNSQLLQVNLYFQISLMTSPIQPPKKTSSVFWLVEIILACRCENVCPLYIGITSTIVSVVLAIGFQTSIPLEKPPVTNFLQIFENSTLKLFKCNLFPSYGNCKVLSCETNYNNIRFL